MSIDIGTQLGSLEITALLGKGGMGEVYRARDTRLKRDVAIKLLPHEFSCDPERVTRFQREAEALASLNHPNIASIHDFQESGGSRYIVLELIDGDTIADRVNQGPIPWREALTIAKTICEALEAAHEKGVIHRDLKPANIKITAEGRIKVLDFGLAKIYEPDGGAPHNVSNSPTMSVMQTTGGVILGTAPYMSPEQARGKNIDKRTDVWAFGCVLYEMLTGKRTFDGEDTTDIIAAVVRTEPDWHKLPGEMPQSIRKLLRRCLEKDRRERLPDIGTARLEIRDALATPAEREPKTGSVAVEHHESTKRPVLAWSLATAFALAAGVILLLWSPWRAPLPATAIRLSAELGADVSLAINVQGNAALAISPDGRVVAFVGERAGVSQIYVRRLEQLETTPLTGTFGATNPFFSPDGQWIGFFADAKLKKISVSGGGSVALCDALAGRGGSWGDDGNIVFHADALTNSGLHKVSSDGGKAEPLTTLYKDEQTQRWPQILPGNKALIYTSSENRSTFEEANIVRQTIPSGVPKVIAHGFHGQYVPSGHLIYIHEATLFAAPFDLSRLEISGPAVPVVEGVFSELNTGAAQFAVSNTGTLAYLPGQSTSNNPLLWISNDGKTTPLRSTPMYWTDPHFSPDGHRLTIDAVGKNGFAVWVYELDRDVLTPLTSGPWEDRKPVWTPDGRRIVFASQRDRSHGLFWQYSDGTGGVQRLSESPNQQMPWSWHPSGKYLAFQESRSGTSVDIMILPMEGDDVSGWKPGKPTAFLSSTAAESEPMFSPDGRWIAYTSNESGRNEVSVRPFPGPGGRNQISTNGGSSAVWSPKRHELLYVAGDFRIMAVPYTSEGNSFKPLKPRVWSEQPIAIRLRTRPFDFDPNGDRIVAAPASPTSANKRVQVVFMFNFFDELRRTTPRRP